MSGLDNVSQNIFGLIALVVSLVALSTTVLQVLQQYFSSAEGYRRCASSVMGLWSEGTHRRLRMYEFRVEVVYETPVIFLGHPSDPRGLSGMASHYINGTERSCIDTKVMIPKGRFKDVPEDERASWVTLLSTLQQEEHESRKWDEGFRNIPIPVIGNWSLQTPPAPEYGLAVGIQRKTRSWDFMPPSVTKPYATSAICHIVEMASMLGMYWKTFDQIMWNLRAEGNGLILTSTHVQGLGVMVSFAITGKPLFEQNRVIPAEGVKDLVFGTVPNIYDYVRTMPDTGVQSLELVFGSETDVNATLESLGCSAQTIERYAKDHKHIFSVSFEIIGMLGQVFRLRGSSFRMIPNPTSDHWVKQTGERASFRVTRIMESFQGKLKELVDMERLEHNEEIIAIRKHWRRFTLLSSWHGEMLNIHCREAIHNALDQTTKYLLSISQTKLLNVLVAHISKVVDVLANPKSALNNMTFWNKEEDLINYYLYQIRPAVIREADSHGGPPSREEVDKRNTIWISLIFRMLCWFLLHEFDQADVKIVPSDLKGSRMPVYIS